MLTHHPQSLMSSVLLVSLMLMMLRDSMMMISIPWEWNMLTAPPVPSGQKLDWLRSLL